MKMKLSEISKKISKGSTPRKKVTYSTKESNYFLRVSDMVNLADIYSSEFTLTNEDINENKMKIWPVNTVLISIEGTVGKISILKKEMTFNQAIAGIIPNEDIINPRYLMYYLRTTPVFSEILKGTIMPALRLGDIGEIEVEVLDMKTQNKLVSIIDSITNKISINNEINNNLHDLINQYYSRYLSELEKYEEIDIKDIFDFEAGVEPGSKNYLSKEEDNCVRFYRVGDMSSSCNTYVNKELVKNKILLEDDVVVSFDATIGRVSYGLSGAYSTGMKKISINDKYKDIIDNSIVYAYFNDKNIQNIMHENARGTTILHASTSINFMKFKYNEKIIKKYIKLINSSFNKMKYIKKENERLEELRDILLPKLMNNEIDLGDINIYS